MTEKTKNLQLEQYGFGPNVMKKTKVCPNCGQLAKSRSMLCSHCGVRLPFTTLFDSYKRRHPCCPHCSTVLTADTKYCPHCGQLINTADHLFDGDADMYVRLRWGMILSFVIGIVLVAIGAVCLIIRAKM